MLPSSGTLAFTEYCSPTPGTIRIAFRRYRAAVLRRAPVPEDLIKMWLGHARSLTDQYATQLREDIGFQLDYRGYKTVVAIDAGKVA